MKYRSRTDIIAGILEAAAQGATKTRLMYNAYLSYAQIKEYVAFLTKKRLLAYHEGSNLYRLTNEGVHYLEAYRQIETLIALEDRGKKRYPLGGMPLPRQSISLSQD